ncbi:MAG: CoA transferase [Actinomycetota bacterium]|nr:CoA transferase [Actinomycetota bacterium]
MEQPLADLVVIELATGIGGPYAGKLFADHGADVIKIEPPKGDHSRREGPRHGPRPGPETSPLFAHLNANKRSVVLDLAQEADRLSLDQLLDGADVVIESSRPGSVVPSGLRPDELRSRHPHLVVTSVTPFGQTGPYAERPGGELIAYAMGGPLNATGIPDREPIKLAGNIVEYQCGAVAATASLAAVMMAQTGGGGVHVDVSNFETQAASIDRRMALLMGWIFMGRLGEREGGNRVGIIPAGVYPNEDGYCQIVFAPNWMSRVAEMLDHDLLTQRLSAPGWMDDLEIPELMAEAVLTWTIQRSKQQAMEDAQSRQLAVMPVNTTTDVLADPHFRERNYWQRVEHPEMGSHEAPGPQFRMADGWRHHRPAPLLGQHTDEVVGSPPEPKDRPAAAGTASLPLEGVRVLDLTVVWAGPLATTLLGDLGAEVIRLDNPNLFPTASRGAIPRPRQGQERELGQYWGAFPDGDGGERPWNRAGAFVIHARGKKGATLDLRTELGRETFLELVDESDVFVENNSAKVLDQLGLGWETLHARNPRLVLCRMPSLGLRGPYRDHIGFGAHMEAICGLTSLRGYLDLDPSVLDATYFMDPASGVTAAFAILGALRRREQTGVGELIEFAQAENLLNYIGEYLIDASLTGEAHERHGNRHPHRAPQGVYPTAGDDRWITISVADDEQWAALVEVMGKPEWALVSDFQEEDRRREHQDELDTRIGHWTSTHDRHALAERLLAAGVDAAPVLDEADLLDDPHLAARGFFRPNSSADVPESLFPGHLWKWDGPDLCWDELNVMGRDNDEIYRGLLGMSDEQMAALDADGHLADGYRDADGNPF